MKSNNFKSLNKKEDANPSMDASSDEIKSPIINKKYNPIIQRRKKNHSKFDKFDIGQISYELNKEYSSINKKNILKWGNEYAKIKKMIFSIECNLIH